MKNNLVKIINVLLAVILVFMFTASVIDTSETVRKTEFSLENMVAHVEKLSENGPRSLVHKAANEKAVEYIASTVASYGFVNEDTTEKPAYLIQDYVATDDTGRYQNFYLQNVIVHIPANAPDATGDAVMFMGHFDSVPMGQGSSDDGVSCAAMLEAIRYYTEKIESGFTLKNDLLFAFVNGEEYNLFGSKALLAEFEGFGGAVDRIRFCTNLESRGTSGTLIMFETAKNNYNTVKLFSEVNKSLFTCSIATLVYDTMPNSTDFTTFKEVCQGLNMANITGGENYHTQNDSPENVGMSYLSQQAEIVHGLIERLGSYDLDLLYDAEESAIFFSYLNLTTVVYNHTASVIIAIVAILLVIANVLISALRKEKRLGKTVLGIVTVVIGLALSAGVCYGFYYLFQYIAVLFGAIDIHMVGTITYSNTAIVVGIGIVALAMTALASFLGCKLFKIEGKDIKRAFAYIHATLGIVLSFVLADASYLFIFSGIMLMINELLITLTKGEFEKYHGELLATALYFPIVIPVIFLATSALGLTMAYVYGIVFALSIFALGVDILPICKYFSILALSPKCCKKKKECPCGGIVTLVLASMIIFLCVSVIRPNASVNLQGKQNIAKLPYDDALVYVLDEEGNAEYRIYDLNAVPALKKYSPKMEYAEEYYVATAEKMTFDVQNHSVLEANMLTVKRNSANSLVYLDFSNIDADSFTVFDGKTAQSYSLADRETYSIKLHSECIVTVNGSADIAYKEVFIDYEPLVPAEYAEDGEKLHFNLWLTAEYSIGN